ncbi:MAG: MerR family transcriptional regulator [Rickettsiaceae bacterium]|nr:MAG: MerR family transcriptional regulator [Rickettsiaceae bacterium]
MYERKYYTIGEATKMLGVSANQLRYIEKTLTQLSINKIKGRRYYTIANVKFIKDKIEQQTSHSQKLVKDGNTTEQNIRFIAINNLIDKFVEISVRIKNIMSN